MHKRAKVAQREKSNENDNDQRGDGPSRGTQDTLVLGDSLIKVLRNDLLSKSAKQKVNVKCFRGATADDMHHYIISPLSKSPENIIIHIGTNHIKKKPASEVCNGIKSLTRKATELCRESHISISSLIKRRDDRAGMISKVNSMNKQILQRI